MGKSKKTLITYILLFSFGTYLHAEFYDPSIEGIEERIMPIGKVRIAEETLNAPNIQTHLGKSIYESHCIICHSTGIAGAPRFGDKKDWQFRIKKKQSLLLEHVKKGYNAMPSKGTCLECTSEDLKKAIFYMTKKSS